MSSFKDYDPYEASKVSRKRDIDSLSELLSLAEEIKSKEEALLLQSMITTAASIGVLTALVAIITIGLPSEGIRELLSDPSLGIFASMGAGVSAAMAIFILQTSKRINREKRAFGEVIGIVHELFEGARRDLTPIETAEIKIRLSRLDH